MLLNFNFMRVSLLHFVGRALKSILSFWKHIINYRETCRNISPWYLKSSSHTKVVKITLSGLPSTMITIKIHMALQSPKKLLYSTGPAGSLGYSGKFLKIQALTVTRETTAVTKHTVLLSLCWAQNDAAFLSAWLTALVSRCWYCTSMTCRLQHTPVQQSEAEAQQTCTDRDYWIQ